MILPVLLQPRLASALLNAPPVHTPAGISLKAGINPLNLFGKHVLSAAGRL